MRERLGLIGFGAFGRLTARHLAPRFEVIAHDPAATPGVGGGEGLATLTDLATAAACPTVVLAVPVEALEATLVAIGPHVRPDALVIEVTGDKGKAEALPRTDASSSAARRPFGI